jgi:hypothetical protein
VMLIRGEAMALPASTESGLAKASPAARSMDYGCFSFFAARIPAAAVSLSHMYAPAFVLP